MSTRSSRVLMRLLGAAFLLLLRSDLNARPVSPHRHHDAHPGIASANHRALLAATTVQKDLDAALPAALASEAPAIDGTFPPAPAPSRDSRPLRSRERTPSQAARPPPLHA